MTIDINKISFKEIAKDVKAIETSCTHDSVVNIHDYHNKHFFVLRDQINPRGEEAKHTAVAWIEHVHTHGMLDKRGNLFWPETSTVCSIYEKYGFISLKELNRTAYSDVKRGLGQSSKHPYYLHAYSQYSRATKET